MVDHLPDIALAKSRTLDYTHPERFYQGLIPWEEASTPESYEERAKKRVRYAPGETSDKHEELCRSCGWSSYNECCSDYTSRLRIMNTRANISMWSIGSKWFLRDQPNDHTLGNDYITQKFLRDQPGLKVPLVKKMISLSDETDSIYFTLMSQTEGTSLYSIYNTLTLEQKLSYGNQLKDIIKELQQFTAPSPQKLDGTPLGDCVLGVCGRFHPPLCSTIGSTTEEWLENIGEELRRGLMLIYRTKNPAIIEAKMQELKDNFPKPEPYVLTHFDLNTSNIMVKDGRIEAIIDWEMAGYYPWWVEHFITVSGQSPYPDALIDQVWTASRQSMKKIPSKRKSLTR